MRNLEVLDIRNYGVRNDVNETLTGFEVLGLSSEYNFADGHAYHDLSPQYNDIINNLSEIWKKSQLTSIPDVENAFKNSFGELIGSSCLKDHPYFSVVPTASNSIDTVAAWLRSNKRNVGLLEPVFDNLYLILKRREVQLQPISEDILFYDLNELEKIIVESKLNALFVVNPNNPTGKTLSQDQLVQLVDMCKRYEVVLILDRTFRFYEHNTVDDYSILVKNGIRFIIIEDTGKTWPTLDMKASLLVYSESIAREMRALYEEIFLCSSNFSTCLLTELIKQTSEVGIDVTIRGEVEFRIRTIAKRLQYTSIVLDGDRTAASLPFAWLNCSKTGMNDLKVVSLLRSANIAVLPGRYFYWNDNSKHISHIRISLMRPSFYFNDGMDRLEITASKLFPNNLQ